jgi:hypothetical protein
MTTQLTMSLALDPGIGVTDASPMRHIITAIPAFALKGSGMYYRSNLKSMTRKRRQRQARNHAEKRRASKQPQREKKKLVKVCNTKAKSQKTKAKWALTGNTRNHTQQCTLSCAEQWRSETGLQPSPPYC